MKPIICWIIGNTSNPYSIECLIESFNTLKKLYQNNALYYLRYNNLDQQTKEKILQIPFDKFIDQHEYEKFLFIDPPKSRFFGGGGWKMYPPQIEPINSYQIFLDNDLIVYEPIFDKFFESNEFVTTEALQRSYTPHLQQFIQNNFNINVGIVGIPPHFILKEKINRIIEENNIKWEEYFDEQTIFAMILQNEKTHILSRETIAIVGNSTKFILGKSGVHFVGLNAGFNDHWLRYKRKGVKF